MACTGESLKYGGSPSTISITIMPRDQMSTCRKRMSRMVPARVGPLGSSVLHRDGSSWPPSWPPAL